MIGIELVLLAAIVFLIGYVMMIYNSLATAKVRIKESLSDIDIQLKRRIDLIPNLIEAVKGYAKHEKETFENVTKAREKLMQATSLKDKAQSDDMLSGALKNLFALAENYPDLKASQNFLDLQQELADTEDKIAYSRRFYNSNVRDYNTTLANFPSGTIAHMFGFQGVEFFEAKEDEKKTVKVQF